MSIKWLCVASGFILFLAIIPTWPYGYYIFLRWSIFISSLIVAYSFNIFKKTGLVLVFGAVAYLFNPIIPVYLTRQMWTPIDFLSAIIFFVGSEAVKENKQ